MAAHTSRVSVTRPRATAAIRAGEELSITGGFGVEMETEYSQRVPMKPGGHWHTGPVKWVKHVPPLSQGNWSQGLVRTEQSLLVKPSVQEQVKSLMPSMQVPALRQGFLAQSSMLVSQREPVKPG